MKAKQSITDTIDEFLDDLEKGLSFTVSDEGLLNKTFFEREKLLNKRWKKSRKCSYPECNAKSIKRSHTISKSASLKTIAEDSFVLTPHFSYKKGEMQMLRVGIGEATTFPGLCIEHEKLYESFENRGYFENTSEINLQIFRSILREKFRFETELSGLKKSLQTMDEFIANELRKRVTCRHGEIVSEKIKEISTNFPQKESLKDLIKGQNESLDEINEFFYKGFESKVTSKAVHIDLVIPVCLSGMTTQEHNGKEFVIIIGVIPDSKGTLITVSYSKKATFSDKKFDFLSEHPLATIKFIEDFMVRNSDQWFIKPSVWDSINPESQQKILNDVMTPRKDLNSEEYSIFNQMKKKIAIDILNNNENPVTLKNVRRELALIDLFSIVGVNK